MKNKTVKLTKAQQRVVNLLQQGWEMGWSDSGRVWMQENGVGRGGETEKVAMATARVLLNTGVIECTKDGFPMKTFGLAPGDAADDSPAT